MSKDVSLQQCYISNTLANQQLFLQPSDEFKNTNLSRSETEVLRPYVQKKIRCEIFRKNYLFPELSIYSVLKSLRLE